ncbi:hypothetical protein CJ419_06345 [Vibrio navarrensis]|nr:hypothetical protein [Vibrio navarrensis]
MTVPLEAFVKLRFHLFDQPIKIVYQKGRFCYVNFTNKPLHISIQICSSFRFVPKLLNMIFVQSELNQKTICHIKEQYILVITVTDGIEHNIFNSVVVNTR